MSLDTDASDSAAGYSEKDTGELAVALAAEKHLSALKDEELASMQKAITRLEGAIEQQFNSAQHEQDRLCALEKSLRRQQDTQPDEEKLMALVAQERERSLALEVAFAAAEKNALAVSLQLRKALTTVTGEEPKRLALEGKLSAIECENERLRHRLAEEESKRQDVEKWMAERSENMVGVRQKLAEFTARRQTSLAGNCASIEKVPSLISLEDDASSPQHMASSPQNMSRAGSHRLSEVANVKVCFLEGESVGQVEDIVQLKRQLAEETAARELAQAKLAEREQTIRELKHQLATDSSKQLALQKERQVCDLQQQLAQELSKRRLLQYDLIEIDQAASEQHQVTTRQVSAGERFQPYVRCASEDLHGQHEAPPYLGYPSPPASPAHIFRTISEDDIDPCGPKSPSSKGAFSKVSRPTSPPGFRYSSVPTLPVSAHCASAPRSAVPDPTHSPSPSMSDIRLARRGSAPGRSKNTGTMEYRQHQYVVPPRITTAASTKAHKVSEQAMFRRVSLASRSYT